MSRRSSSLWIQRRRRRWPPPVPPLSTSQSIPNIVEEDDEAHHHHSSRVANLIKLIGVELDLLIESFEEAKRRIGPVIAQISEARDKFDELRQQRGGGRQIMEMLTKLRELKQTTSKLKSKIPFDLIAPEYQPAADPNVIFQPRPNPLTTTTTITYNLNLVVVVDEELVDNTSLMVADYIHIPLRCFLRPGNRRALGFIALWCFFAFPEGAFIKASLLSSFMYSTSTWLAAPGYSSTLQLIALTAAQLVSKGLIKSVYKKHSSSTSTVYGFWMDPRLRPTIKELLSTRISPGTRLPESLVVSSSVDGEEDIIYRDSADPSTIPSNLEFLHLGMWQWSPTHHIEMPDPNLYFKYSSANLHNLTYISFRGVSVMKELPGFITHLCDLSILDLKACHHLEAIPSNIGNLWCDLTHLDMSECYFLDHMPASLSKLTNLIVLKGFYVRETNNDESCTLQDLSSLTLLFKLNIYTSLKTFPNEDQLTILQGFEYLRNFTICWGGCSTRNENRESKPKKSATIRLKRLATSDHDPAVGVKEFSFNLEKLDLRGVPEKDTRSWLRPSNFKKLEKLYIRGGQLTHLRNVKEFQKDTGLAAVEQTGWSVKHLRLRHLSKMQMDWSELKNSFPNLIIVEKVECPNLTSFPRDDSGLWTDTMQPPLS